MPGDPDSSEAGLPPAPGALDSSGQQLPPDLPSDGIELQYGPGGFPPHYPGSGTLVPVRDDTEPAV